MIRNLESIRVEYEARIAVLEAEKSRLYHALGTLAFEVKSLRAMLESDRLAVE